MDAAVAKDVLSWPADKVGRRLVAELIPYARNARTHSPEQVAQIAASIREWGWTIPVLIDETGGIIAGHGRVMAAQKLGIVDVPCMVASGWTKAQKQAYTLADNKLALNAGWDLDALQVELQEIQASTFDEMLIGFSADEFAALTVDETNGLINPDEVPEPQEQAVSQPGDLWILGDHRLLCGDSTKAENVQRVMAGERAILFATDPPYLVDYDGTNHPSKQSDKGSKKDKDKNKDWGESYGITWDDSSQGPELYEGFIKAAVEDAIKPNAAWYCWHASRRQAMVEAVWEKYGAFVHQQIIWAKDRGILTRSYYLWQHEPCFFGWIRGNMPPKIDGAVWASTIWQIPTVKVGEKTDHPTAKPLDVFAIPMRQHARPGEICYEPFSGSGSQIIAGEATGRRVFAIEISPQYVDVAVKRWQMATTRLAVLEGDGHSFDEIAGERLGAPA